jgi:PHD/YefM family antitoxin component YafN of YafNO toxin-antitoxin module
VPELTADLAIFEDAASEPVSTLEALNDIADTVEAIVLSLAAGSERDAYLALVDEYEAFDDDLPEEPELRSAEQTARILELAKRLEDVFEAILRGCPSDIRALHAAVQTAIDAEASRA